jgi:hydrogenase expression/formation protein HypD
MKYIDEFRDFRLVKKVVKEIERLSNDKKVNLMEVCGTHTVAIFKHGIKDLLPEGITMLSGPGCPVCVTPTSDIDAIIALARKDNNCIIATFGDMMKVPGTYSSLEEEKACGADIRVVYSALDALNIAIEHPNKIVIFFAVGFETTSPTVAVCIKQAESKKINNFYILSAHKLIPPAMQALLTLGEVKIEGFLCPGHVSTIIGSRPYEFITRRFHIPCVIAGFEPLDILQGIYMLLKQKYEKRQEVEIQYTRCVRQEGNPKAIDILYEVFEPCSSSWRGIGEIPDSGLKLKEKYLRFDAKRNFKIQIEKSQEEKKGCICGAILRGVKTPYDCEHFGKSCTPESPIGPCMVSSEGTCSAYYKYKRQR